jgi:hypothetical protein
MNLHHGEYCSIQFSSTDASSGGSVALYDINGVARTLQAYERLIIDRLTLNAATGAGLVTLYSDDNSGGTVDAGERIAEWNDAVTLFSGGPEGYACGQGITPKVLAATAGQVSVNGVGRIVATSQTGRPTWRESLKGRALA